MENSSSFQYLIGFYAVHNKKGNRDSLHEVEGTVVGWVDDHLIIKDKEGNLHSGRFFKWVVTENVND